jgi:long-chain acyl-CoA synthetase
VNSTLPPTMSGTKAARQAGNEIAESWGEVVHAIVVLHPGRSATDQELLGHARESIAGYKVPKSIEFRAQPLPLSGAMKVLKRELRAPYWEGRARHVN